MKKILFIHHAAGWGGAPINMINIINSLDKTNYEAEVLLIKNSMVADKLKNNNIKYSLAKSKFYQKHYQFLSHSEAGYIKWYQLFKFLILFALWLLSRNYFALRELKHHKFDIVHLNSSVLTDWLYPASRVAKVIIHIQEPFRKGKIDILNKFLTYQMRKYTDRIIAISQDNARRIGVPEKTEVIYNYSEIPENIPPETSYHSKKVLYLGGAAHIKGFYTMVEALDYLDKDIKVYFGGSYTSNKKTKNAFFSIIKWITNYGKKKQQAIQKMRNSSNAVELGMIHNVDQYLEEVCCLVSPFSTAHFARPVIEAHLHKKPAIGSEVQGMQEIIEHNVTGLLFERDNPKALAKAINELVNQPDKVRAMGENGFEIAINKFSPKNISQFKEIYSSLAQC